MKRWSSPPADSSDTPLLSSSPLVCLPPSASLIPQPPPSLCLFSWLDVFTSEKRWRTKKGAASYFWTFLFWFLFDAALRWSDMILIQFLFWNPIEVRHLYFCPLKRPDGTKERRKDGIFWGQRHLCVARGVRPGFHREFTVWKTQASMGQVLLVCGPST